MIESRTPRWLFPALLVGAAAACASGASGGLARGPSGDATIVRIGVPPDTVVQRAWEVLRNDGVMARSFQRTTGDTTNIARMESDWIYVPRVLQSIAFGHLSEPEKWVKLLFWAEPQRGGTLLYLEALYNPLSMPTEPVQWSRMRSVPGAHPAWQYVEVVGRNLERRLGEDPEESESTEN